MSSAIQINNTMSENYLSEIFGNVKNSCFKEIYLLSNTYENSEFSKTAFCCCGTDAAQQQTSNATDLAIRRRRLANAADAENAMHAACHAVSHTASWIVESIVLSY